MTATNVSNAVTRQAARLKALKAIDKALQQLDAEDQRAVLAELALANGNRSGGE